MKYHRIDSDSIQLKIRYLYFFSRSWTRQNEHNSSNTILFEGINTSQFVGGKHSNYRLLFNIIFQFLEFIVVDNFRCFVSVLYDLQWKIFNILRELFDDPILTKTSNKNLSNFQQCNNTDFTLFKHQRAAKWHDQTPDEFYDALKST